MTEEKKIKLLLVEDKDNDIKTCKDSAAVYSKKKCEIELVVCKNIYDASRELDNSFDGAIIDLNLGEGNEGNIITEKIKSSFFRIPIVILTATPSAASDRFTYIGVYKKGEVGFTEIFDDFCDIYNTGLTKIMGGRGVIEEKLNKVYLENILKRVDPWVTYGKEDSERTEKALLRHIINHLFQLLDDDESEWFPEEVYLLPLSDSPRTGSIVKVNNVEDRYAILNPACDLIIRNGKPKTDRILLIGIENQRLILKEALKDIKQKEKKEKKLREISKNNYTDYYHWLPKAASFSGGFLNFRDINSVGIKDFNKNYEKPKIQISPSCIKDIISRFSSYYARQGQPDIKCKDFIEQQNKNNGCT